MSVVGLFGPTASGKTAVAEALAHRIPAEIVSADSMQAYQGLPLLTNQGAGRLVGIWPSDRQRTVGEYQKLAHAAIDGALAAGRTPIVVGGSGLYFRAALADLKLPPHVPEGKRARWERLYDRFGGQATHALLRERDRSAAEQVHPNDRKRVIWHLSSGAPAPRLLPPPPGSGRRRRATRRRSWASTCRASFSTSESWSERGRCSSEALSGRYATRARSCRRYSASRRSGRYRAKRRRRRSSG